MEENLSKQKIPVSRIDDTVIKVSGAEQNTSSSIFSPLVTARVIKPNEVLETMVD